MAGGLVSMAVVGMALVLAGCGPTVIELNVAYFPPEPPSEVQMKSAKKIKVEKFSDKRARELGEILSKRGREGKYVAKGDVSDIVTNAVKLELANQGYQIVQENEDLILSGAVLLLEGRVVPAVFGGRVKGVAQVSLSLKESQQEKIIWSDRVRGKSEVKYGMFTNVHSRTEEAINLAIKSLMDNVTQSESLHAALK